jgi:hypothetical protein
MSEVLKAFQFISENVPDWIAILDALETKIKEREDHVSRAPVPARKLKKTGSNESIRPKLSGKDATLGVISTPQDGDLANPIDQPKLLSPNRKRKTASVASNESVPSKFRTRSMIIVYYDSEIQKSFEQVVRHIGTARNGLRRAKTTLRMEALTSAHGFSDMLGPPRSSSGYAPLAMFRTARGPPPRPGMGADPKSSQTDILTSADLALEKAQSLCERGAHQFLRDGDSEAEIIGAKDSFEEAKHMADTEIARLQKETKEKETAIEQKEDDSKNEKRDANLEEYLQHGVLEVDDSPTDGDDVDDPMMDLARLRQRRAGGGPLTIPS